MTRDSIITAATTVINDLIGAVGRKVHCAVLFLDLSHLIQWLKDCP